MGHQDLKTTQIYLSFKPQRDAAKRFSQAFSGSGASADLAEDDRAVGSPQS